MNPAPFDEELGRTLVRLGIAARPEDVHATRLSGGVSADIWKVQCADRVVCVKKARSQLKVAQDWRVPTERIAYERKWHTTVGRILPGVAPAVLAYDDASSLLVMEYLAPESTRLWKSELAAGRVDVAFAGTVGAKLGTIHASTAGSADCAGEFQTDVLFTALRLDPYFRHCGNVLPNVAGYMEALVESILQRKHALVHGDVSPKNILLGPQGPIFLDAECAWYGDPAFDVAFLLNHLLLKSVWVRRAAKECLAAFDAFASSYGAHISWEQPDELWCQVIRTLPALLLARIDGKSPVEYLTSESDRSAIRRCALLLIREPAKSLGEIRDCFSKEQRP